MLEGRLRVALKMSVRKVTEGKNTLRMLEVLGMSCFMSRVVSMANAGAKILILSSTDK